MVRQAPATSADPSDRLGHIERARRAILSGEARETGSPSGLVSGVEGWIERSWRRCLAQGQRPEQVPAFNAVTAPMLRRTLEANRVLLAAAGPVLDKLSLAIKDTRYFAILTDRTGVVVDARGDIDRRDPRADLITRLGTDLSEASHGTTAISAALAELQPVWLHRGEHFFDANAAYSCAGAPLFGPDGQCVGMLDLTGIQAVERPELRHLVSQAACSIDNALTLACLTPHSGPSGLPRHQGLVVRLNWPGRILGDETDGLVCLDADGYVLGANQNARRMVPQLELLRLRSAASLQPAGTKAAPVHSSDLFAVAVDLLFDAARQSSAAVIDVPLWTGLRLHAMPRLSGARQTMGLMGASVNPGADDHTLQAPNALVSRTHAAHSPLKEIETALIRQAVNDARGNVLQAAKALGVSRATVYRRLGRSGRTTCNSAERLDPLDPAA